MHLVTSNAMPVIRAVSLVLAHVPSLVRLGSKPLRVLRDVEQPIEYLRPHLRDWDAARTYAPNQVFIGNVDVDELAARPFPWHRHPVAEAGRFGPDGEIMPEDEFLGLLATCDGFDLLALTGEVADRARSTLDAHPVVGRASGRPTVPAGVATAVLDERIARHRAVPLVSVDGRLLGAMLPGHDDDDTLTGQVLLENLACKATAGLALRHLLARPGAIAANDVRYVINCGEEAVGDRYQRGGGNLAKVVAGGSLAKLGMKFQGHVKHAMPIVEDVLAGFAAHVARDDGVSPVLRLDAIGRHEVGSGSAPLAIMKALYTEPLGRVGLTLLDVDRFSLELHNLEATEPAGSGNVPLNNYRTLASLAVVEKLIARESIDDFVRTRGMPGFSPTQGHIASAIPYLGHARRGLTEGSFTRTMFAGKGSLFLGRMTQLPDGLSLVLERNGAS